MTIAPWDGAHDLPVQHARSLDRLPPRARDDHDVAPCRIVRVGPETEGMWTWHGCGWGSLESGSWGRPTSTRSAGFRTLRSWRWRAPARSARPATPTSLASSGRTATTAT